MCFCIVICQNTENRFKGVTEDNKQLKHILMCLSQQTLQQNNELRRRLQRIHTESAVVGPITEPRLAPSHKDVSLQMSLQASSNRVSITFCTASIPLYSIIGPCGLMDISFIWFSIYLLVCSVHFENWLIPG